MSLQTRLAKLEKLSARLVQRQELRRAAYLSDWQDHHRQMATVLGADSPEEIDFAARGLIPMPARDPEEVALSVKRDREREAGLAEAAASTTQARTAAWESKRREILVERARYRRKCEEEGQHVVFAAGEPPVTVPDWFQPPKPDGVRFTHVRRPVTKAGEQRIDLDGYDAVAGRKVGPPLELTPNEIFALEDAKTSKEKQK